MGLFEDENRKTERVLIKKARALSNRKNRIFYFNAAKLSVYGWQMAIPVLLGILMGRFLDSHFPASHFSWTLNLIIIGFGVGFFNATRWVHQAGKVDKKHKK